MPIEIPEELRGLDAVGIARLVDGEKGRAGWEQIVAAKRTWKDEHPDRRHGPDICSTALLNSGACNALEIDWAELRPMLGADSAAAYFGFCAQCVGLIEAAGMRVLAGSHKEAVQAAQREREGAPDRRMAHGPDIRPGRVIGDSGDAVPRRVVPERAERHRVTPPPPATAVSAAPAVAVAEQRVETPAPAATTVDPIAAMDLVTVEQQLAILRLMREAMVTMGDGPAYARIVAAHLRRRRELEDERIAAQRRQEDEELARVRATEDAELGTILGKGRSEPVKPAQVLRLVPRQDEPDPVQVTIGVLRAACDPRSAPDLRIRTQIETSGKVAKVYCVVASNSAACSKVAPPTEMAVRETRLRDGSHIYLPICRPCKAIGAGVGIQLLHGKTYADFLTDEERHGCEEAFPSGSVTEVPTGAGGRQKPRPKARPKGPSINAPKCEYCNGSGGTKMHEGKPACVRCKNTLTAGKREGRRNARAANDADLRTRMRGASGGGGRGKRGGGKR